MVDNASALIVLQTATFRRWLLSLEDERARARVAQRIKRAEMGNLGDIRSVGGGVLEMRVDYGPGYRVYCARRNRLLVLLLCGGDKRTQPADIKRAQRMVQEIGP